MSFKFAGVRVLEGCAPHIRKVLKQGELYLLSSRYESSSDINSLSFRQNQGLKITANTLYNIYDERCCIEISINAIVGKNGDGKSTIVEIILRILNNFAFSYGFLNDQPSLKYIDNIYAILYYEIDSVIYSIRCDGKSVKWYKSGNEVFVPNINEISKKKYLKENLSADLFYAMVINYSLYAYTSTSLGANLSETGCWINELFHKNDSYQTPVVLNPMRMNGNIDINKEEYLSRQRLMSIFANSTEQDTIRMVSATEKAVGYAFSLEQESKFIRMSVRSYLLDHFHDEVIWEDMTPFMYQQKQVPDDLIFRFGQFWEPLSGELAENYNLIYLFKETLIERTRARKTDLRKYLTKINDAVYPQNPNTKRRPRNGFGKEFSMLVNTSGDLSKLNFVQFYRMLLIMMVWRTLTETNMCHMRGEKLNEVLQHPTVPRNAAMLYLLYKFISIVETYKGFCNGYYLDYKSYHLFISEWPNRDIAGTMRHDLDVIMGTNDYRTIKFRQTVNYLREGSEYYGAQVCKLKGINFEYYISFDALNNRMRNIHLKDIQSYLPCPIFIGDIVLYNKSEFFTLGTLSSGMIQRLNTVGSLVYHLRNLDDEQIADTMLSYENIAIILEEVELYYHPEYQKSYLKFLLEQISRAGLRRIRRLNLIFITHSPFVLSDIMDENILCLDHGRSVNVPCKTFGANIHDLLQHPFFMKHGVIGDFAQEIINRMIVSLAIYDSINRVKGRFDVKQFRTDNEILNKYMDFLPYDDNGDLLIKEFETKYSKCLLRETIELIAEPIVREALKQEYDRVFK